MNDVQSYRNSLPLDTMLFEFRLESILGAGGFGMTYLGYDTNLEKKVAIKEYLPVELAVRALDGSVVPISTNTEHDYKWGLDRFLQEARLLAKFGHPNIVVVSRYFEANGTAYMVMNYESGLSLNQLLKRDPHPTEAQLTGMLMPLLDGLREVHNAGFLHRDIKPSNIFIRDNNAPLLIDFGAARLAIGGVTKAMTSILTPGYAPLEQYSPNGNQGPWTDIYSLAAVMYRAVVGDNPPDAVTRLKDDNVMNSLLTRSNHFSAGFLQAIGHGMEVEEKKRPQSVPAWQVMFGGEFPIVPPPQTAVAGAPAAAGTSIGDAPTRPAPSSTIIVNSRPSAPRKQLTQLTQMAVGALVLFLVIGGAQFYEKLSGKSGAKSGVTADGKSASGNKPPKLTAREFYVLDRDRSGFLTPDEVKGDAVLEQNFKKIDINRDGRISLEEFTSYPPD